MQTKHAIAALLLFICAGCGRASAGDSDFVPPEGRAENAPPQSAGERRLILATSTDAKTFSPTGDILTDQGNVPDAVVDAAGRVHVYYVAQGIERGRESTVVAISSDNGKTWSYHLLGFESWPTLRDPSDPDVVLLEDGTFRMYFTSSLSNGDLGIVYADSPDGITFTYKGEAFAPGFTVIDSSTFLFDGVWHMYVLDEKKPVQYHATSSDGLEFEISDKTLALTVEDKVYIGSNPLIEDEQIRLFGFGGPGSDIRSFASTDGETWKVEAGSRLVADTASLHGGSYLQDSTVVQLADGTYLMVYVSDIPE